MGSRGASSRSGGAGGGATAGPSPAQVAAAGLTEGVTNSEFDAASKQRAVSESVMKDLRSFTDAPLAANALAGKGFNVTVEKTPFGAIPGSSDQTMVASKSVAGYDIQVSGVMGRAGNGLTLENTFPTTLGVDGMMLRVRKDGKNVGSLRIRRTTTTEDFANRVEAAARNIIRGLL
jgi:hypothetical protein